jgi:glycosyltransferase involved in cell wall biosynthesis
MLRSKLAGVFAISPRAVTQFRQMGIASERIYPFGYFVPPFEVSASRTKPERRLRCIFVGRLIKRKGIATILEAFAGSPMLRANATLDIYGIGDIGATELPEGVRYCGTLPSGQPIQVMADADVVIVPSLFDGWGVVVNEAILAGTPVIASDAVGAAAMLQRWGCGRLFPAGDGKSLAALLEQLVAGRDKLSEMQGATEALALQLHPEVAARFMRDCMVSHIADHPRPVAPWY